MVFVSLSVQNIKESKNFYVDTLGLFKLVDSNRIICDSGIDLIIDLYQVESDEHINVFEQKEHVISDLALGYDKSELLLCDTLEANLFDFDLQNCIAGSFLRLKDPSGNKLTISHQKCGGIR
jgi:catechol 2,3-dioxygenase-like lactoylglutathione lyase family enzyme